MIRTDFNVIFILTILPYIFRSNSKAEQVQNNIFPNDFLFGIGTSALLYEGAWNESDKGESVWDSMLHANPALVMDKSNADVANDFYHKYQGDVRRAKSIGTQLFKLSLSWPRILPSGFINHVSQDGVRFYKNLIDDILANGMIPMVTIFQWDLPNTMQKMGGLANPMFVDWFADYAGFVFATFGDKVKFWITIDESNNLCSNAYGWLYFIPSINLPGIADYLCGHYVLLAHAKAYRLYNREFRVRQKGSVGITNDYVWYIPENSLSEKDSVAAEDAYVWYNKWLMDPIFSSTGDYPRIMREQIDSKSRAEGYSASRLPKFTENEIHDIRGSADFLGLKYFAYESVKAMEWNQSITSYDNDVGAVALDYIQQDAPWMFAKVIQHINEDYHRPIIFIENGYPDSDHIEDVAKTTYLRGHLAEVLKAIQNGVDIRGYIIWSLLDSFDWRHGYQLKYGLFQVDFSSKNLIRTPRLSSRYIARVYQTRRLEKYDDSELRTVEDSIE